jgi:hypothetical protein
MGLGMVTVGASASVGSDVDARAQGGSDADVRADMGANVGMAALVGGKVGMSTAGGTAGTSSKRESAASVDISHNCC